MFEEQMRMTSLVNLSFMLRLYVKKCVLVSRSLYFLHKEALSFLTHCIVCVLVQSPKGDISYLQKFFLMYVGGRQPLHFQEDFCGTALLR